MIAPVLYREPNLAMKLLLWFLTVLFLTFGAIGLMAMFNAVFPCP